MPAEQPWPPLFEELPAELESGFDPGSPWSLLDEPLEEALAALPSSEIATPLDPGVHLAGDGIVIGPGARIHPGATIEGPIRIGRDVEIRPGAYLRGGVWLGDGCVVGANVEVKRSIFLDGAKAPHLNYVGDSILGRGVNLGAGTILSNLRHDGREVRIPKGEERLSTGRRKLGAILGDGVLTGCNCMLNPGVVIGRSTHLYGGLQLRAGVYPADSIIKLRQTQQIVERR
jgi:NDP-sugar pyrophosphorylase family protein